MLSLSLSSCGGYKSLNRKIDQAPGWVDDTIHVGIGAGVAAGVYYILPEDTDPAMKAIYAVLGSLTVGVVIESLDKNFDYVDVLGYGAGAILIVPIISGTF